MNSWLFFTHFYLYSASNQKPIFYKRFIRPMYIYTTYLSYVMRGRGNISFTKDIHLNIIFILQSDYGHIVFPFHSHCIFCIFNLLDCDDNPSANCSIYNTAIICDTTGIYYPWARRNCRLRCGFCQSICTFYCIS